MPEFLPGKFIKRKLIVTEDGSHSFFVPEVGESFHSKHGAVQESRHVFIESGLKQITKTKINILEIGFGSGLNALLSYDFSKRNNIKINYETLELNPISIEEASLINYPEVLGLSKSDFLAFHNCLWEKEAELFPGFNFLKKRIDLLKFKPENNSDLIYFDAFSPESQPELWKTPIFSNLYNKLNPGGILTSYSVRGDFRRSLKEVGFKVEKIPGPPGKRHITRAIKEIK